MRQMKKLLAALLASALLLTGCTGGTSPEEQHRFRRGAQHCIPGAAHR